MEAYRVKKVHCLTCDSILEAWFSTTKCDCENNTILDNRFRFTTPNSIISAKDKTKLKAKALEDFPFSKKDEWFFVREPEDENTPKCREWVGQTGGNYHALCEGIVVKFFTEEAMTANECRMLLKKQVIKEQDNYLRVYHFWQEYNEKFDELIVKEREKVLILKNAKTVTLKEIVSNKTDD